MARTREREEEKSQKLPTHDDDGDEKTETPISMLGQIVMLKYLARSD